MAPAYGEADFLTLQAAGLDVLVDPIDAQGRFTEAIPDVPGPAQGRRPDPHRDVEGTPGLLYRDDQIRHSYPFCYRTGTPLMYKAIPTWFVRVEAFKDRLVAQNETIHWVPEHVGASGVSETGSKTPATGPYQPQPLLGFAASRSGSARTGTRSASARSMSWPSCSGVRARPTSTSTSSTR